MSLAAPLSRVLLADRAASRPVAYCRDQVFDWADFRSRVADRAAALARRREQSWALVCEDAYYFLCGLFAALHAGRRVVIPPNFLPGTLERLQPEVDGFMVEEIDRCAPPHGTGFGIAGSVVANAAVARPVAEDAVIDLFTSGTTGAPKRIRKRFRQLASEVEVLESVWGAELESAVTVATVPHHHIYGLLFRLLWPLHAGRPFDVVACGDPNELVVRLAKFRRGCVISSPAQLSRLPELMDPARLAPQALRIFSSGGPLPPKAALAFAGSFGCAPTEIYGSSETGGIAWRVQSDDPLSQAWSPQPRVQVQVGADGALQVRSPFIESDAWFITGDGAELLSDGRFRLLGRLDRVVKVEEKRLSLTELEERLCRHPWINEAGAVLLQGSRQVVGVVLALTPDAWERSQRDGKRAVVAELRRFLADYYEPTLLPRQWRLTRALPQNDRGKISPPELAALFAQPD